MFEIRLGCSSACRPCHTKQRKLRKQKHQPDDHHRAVELIDVGPLLHLLDLIACCDDIALFWYVEERAENAQSHPQEEILVIEGKREH